MSTATEVTKKCAGLPIAISTVAKSLRNKGSFAWRDALRQLNKPSSSNFSGISADAYSAIELSYNSLESEEVKQTFLLCSLLGHHAHLQDLLKYAMGLGLFHGVRTVEETRDRLLTVVSDLKASCLLLDSYNSQRFDMHDLICDVAISIASKDNRVFALRHEDVLHDWPDEETTKRWDKISLLSASIISKVPDQLKCPKLTLFYIRSKDPSMEIPTEFFREMMNLKVLDLTKMHFPSLPLSISALSNLRTLCLDDCVLGDISIVGELKNLEILSFLWSDIERLPKEIGQLIKLKLLDLTRCTKLQIIPPNVLSSLSRLEELYMGNSFVQWEAEGHPSEPRNASLAELKALSCLTAFDVHIPNAKMIPKDDFFFEKLKRYAIFIGEARDWEYDIEYKRTLKLKLHTSIGHLGCGMKMLLMKAENLYVEEMKDVEILLHKSEGRECFQQLKNLHIQNGASIQHIIKDDGVDKIEFVQLDSLTLQGLPKLISFCSQNKGSTSSSPQGLPLFNEKMVFPKLDNLKLSSVGIERIWQYQLPRGSLSFSNLTSFIIEGCNNLKHVLSFSMAECLEQLKSLEIVDCNSIQLIISTEETLTKEDGKRAAISFPRLNSVKLKGLEKLISFCHEDYIVEFQSLTTLKIKHCPELKGFITSKTLGKDIATSSSTDEVLFNEKVAFPSLEKMTISHLRNVKSIWHNQLHQDSFCNLKKLKVEYCDGLLKHVWSKDPQGKYSFQNLREVTVRECWSLKSLFPFSIAKGLMYLESLEVNCCGVEEIVSEKIFEGLQEDICFEFRQLSFLVLWELPEFKCFYPGVHITLWPVLKKLRTYKCEKIKIFGIRNSKIQQPLFLVETDIPQLQEVFFSSDDIAMICDGQQARDIFAHIESLGITHYLDKSIVFPFCFLQKFHDLQMLEVVGCDFKELSPYEGDAGEEEGMTWTLPKIKKLKLNGCDKITQLWTQDSGMDHIYASVETLEVWDCDSLINLASASSSFQNLTYLEVWDCKAMSELIVSSKAQSLGCLVRMKIRECEMMTEIVASEGADEATYDIIFKELKYLHLHSLENLKSFCSGKHTFKFPSLEEVYASKCPRLKSFCEGALFTPKLEIVCVEETYDYKGHWEIDLNATIEQLHEKTGVTCEVI